MEYLAGKGVPVDHERFNPRKPDSIKRLGPFLDDIVMALVVGTMYRICR